MKNQNRTIANKQKRGWDKSPSLSIIFGLSSKTQWLSGLYYANFISFYSPTQLCGGGTTKSNSNELPISVPLSFLTALSSPFSLWVRADRKIANSIQIRQQRALIGWHQSFVSQSNLGSTLYNNSLEIPVVACQPSP